MGDHFGVLPLTSVKIPLSLDQPFPISQDMEEFLSFESITAPALLSTVFGGPSTAQSPNTSALNPTLLQRQGCYDTKLDETKSKLCWVWSKVPEACQPIWQFKVKGFGVAGVIFSGLEGRFGVGRVLRVDICEGPSELVPCRVQTGCDTGF